MQGYDILMLVILGGAALFGAWKGLAWQVASFASISLSYFVACEFREDLSGQINVEPPWNKFVAMLILFLGTSLAVWLVFGMIRNAISRMKLKEFDRQAGFLLGVAKGVVVCTLVTLFAVTLLGETQRQAIIGSQSGFYIAKLLDQSEGLLPGEVHEFLHPYIENFERGRDGEPAPDGNGFSIPLPANIPSIGDTDDLMEQARRRVEDALKNSDQRGSTDRRPNDEFRWSPPPGDDW